MKRRIDLAGLSFCFALAGACSVPQDIGFTSARPSAAERVQAQQAGPPAEIVGRWRQPDTGISYDFIVAGTFADSFRGEGTYLVTAKHLELAYAANSASVPAATEVRTFRFI